MEESTSPLESGNRLLPEENSTSKYVIRMADTDRCNESTGIEFADWILKHNSQERKPPFSGATVSNSSKGLIEGGDNSKINTGQEIDEPCPELNVPSQNLPIQQSDLGNFHWTLEDVAKSIVCIMSSPCQAGYTQMLNDWYAREIDAINEPYRPIPSGAISENEETSLLKFFPSGDYPNLGTAFGRPWLGWFIGCVGRAGHCFRQILSILHLLSSTFEGNSTNKTGHASLVSIR